MYLVVQNICKQAFYDAVKSGLSYILKMFNEDLFFYLVFEQLVALPVRIAQVP
jgi:hypothetical protein